MHRLNYIFIAFTCFLCACADPSLTDQDRMFLDEYRADSDPKYSSDILYQLMNNNPERLARNAAKKGDYRLVAFAGGYHAQNKDAHVFGATCKITAETKNIVTGCILPPAVFFKLIKRYNVELIRQPGFPQQQSCAADNSVDEWINKDEAEMDVALKKDAEKKAQEAKKANDDAIEVWQYKQKHKPYND